MSTSARRKVAMTAPVPQMSKRTYDELLQDMAIEKKDLEQVMKRIKTIENEITEHPVNGILEQVEIDKLQIDSLWDHRALTGDAVNYYHNEVDALLYRCKEHNITKENYKKQEEYIFAYTRVYSKFENHGLNAEDHDALIHKVVRTSDDLPYDETYFQSLIKDALCELGVF